MTKVTTDRDIIRGENVSTPTYVAQDSSTQYYKLQAKTNIGSIALTKRAVSITRNS